MGSLSLVRHCRARGRADDGPIDRDQSRTARRSGGARDSDDEVTSVLDDVWRSDPRRSIMIAADSHGLLITRQRRPRGPTPRCIATSCEARGRVTEPDVERRAALSPPARGIGRTYVGSFAGSRKWAPTSTSWRSLRRTRHRAMSAPCCLLRASAATGRTADARVEVPCDRCSAQLVDRARHFDGRTLWRGAADAVHSVAMHDLLWRDDVNESTAREYVFTKVACRYCERARMCESSPVHRASKTNWSLTVLKLIVSIPCVWEWTTTGRSRERGRSAWSVGPTRCGGPYTLYVGTREPRKNLERLIRAHRDALAESPELGPLVLVDRPAGQRGH